MYKLYPYFTNDGSTGLYSPSDNDVYHSVYGALTEAYEKFVLPSEPDFYFDNLSEVKVLDICYGIGYNSKSFLNYFYEKKYIKNNYNDKIYTDNIQIKNYNVPIDNDNKNHSKEESPTYKIYTDNDLNKEILPLHENNKNLKVYIKAIDTDRTLALLSPFIICNKNNLPKEYKLPFDNAKISGMLNKPPKTRIKFYEEINLILFIKIAEKYPEILKNEDIIEILNTKEYAQYLDPYIYRLFELKQKDTNNIPWNNLTASLHNIYYEYISMRYKKALNTNILNDFIFDLKINDARQELIKDSNLYNLIFLDAFTPAKCPALWSVDFFRLLFEHLADNGKILTYSNSAAVRNAFLNAGFYIGKIYNPSSNKFMGTIAVKNKDLIKNELSEFDLGLLKTKAGIFYRDKNFTGLNDEILAARKIEVENSDLLSSSQFIKNFTNM